MFSFHGDSDETGEGAKCKGYESPKSQSHTDHARTRVASPHARLAYQSGSRKETGGTFNWIIGKEFKKRIFTKVW